MVVQPPIEYASLGMADTLILMILALVVFGPRRLPQIGRQLGKLMYEFRKASNDFKYQMEEELRNAEEADRRKKEEERQLALVATSATPADPAAEARAPVADQQFPVPEVASPYPGEALYPVQPSASETAPQVQPPSTGEQVSAAPPNRALEVSEEAVLASASDPVPAPAENKLEKTPEQGAPVTEPVNHNG